MDDSPRCPPHLRAMVHEGWEAPGAVDGLLPFELVIRPCTNADGTFGAKGLSLHERKEIGEVFTWEHNANGCFCMRTALMTGHDDSLHPKGEPIIVFSANCKLGEEDT